MSGTTDPVNQLNFLSELRDITQEDYLDLLREQAPYSLSCFVEFFTPDEPPALHHDWMCEKLEDIEQRNIMRMLLSLPPGHAKTKFCTRYFPAWYIGKNPRHRYLQGGHSQDFVEKEFGKYVRDIISDPRYSSIFPEVYISATSRASGNWKVNNISGGYVAKGVGQGIAGYRGNIGGIDDPFANLADADSPKIRETVHSWFMADFSTRLLPFSPLFIIATRWNVDDLCGRVEDMNKEGRGLPWEIINLPAVIETEEDQEKDPFDRQMGDVLWPDYYSSAELSEKKATLLPRIWNALYQGKPVNEEGDILHGIWIKRYKYRPVDKTIADGDISEKVIRRITLSVDCAAKKNDRADYTAITVWIETMDRCHYLVDVTREKLEFPEMVMKIESKARYWKVNAILVEDSGSGTQYIQSRAGLAPAPVITIKAPAKSKEFRFDGVVPMFQAGEVYFPEQAPWLPEYERELLEFPNGSKDDQVDSTSQYLSWARRGKRLGSVKLKGTNVV